MTPRLYIDAPLAADNVVALSQAQVHYLKNVLRKEEGREVLVFNGNEGEFSAKLVELKKRGGLAAVGPQTRAPEREPYLTLLFAPVKRGPLEMIIQKATELGVSHLAPVLTERTVAPKLNIERLQAIAVEAAEQCGRLSVPSVDKPIKLAALVEAWPQDRRIIFCDEAGDDETKEWGGDNGRAAPILETLNRTDSKAQQDVVSGAILTGPEGGFSPAERAMLRAEPFVIPVTLGPRILRADTAVIAALALWQSAVGDWRDGVVTDA